MPVPILSTKLYKPPQRSNLVSRPYLLELLNEGLEYERKLTLVSAPAGYGKSTLLVEWLHSSPIVFEDTAWLSLDKADNDPKRFWLYFFSALQTIPRLGETDAVGNALESLQSSQPPLVQVLLMDLINAIFDLSRPSILVLDDLHLISETEIHEQLLFLIENLPSPSNELHLAIATRQDPPWPMAKFRSRGDLTEIRVNELRFNKDESIHFFKSIDELDLNDEQIASLDSRIEGWIAGLQMAAISMKGRDQIAVFIDEFSGAHRYVLDYLIEEVINQQTLYVQDFLLKTSVLDRMTADLCRAVWVSEESDRILIQNGPGSGIDSHSSTSELQALLTQLEQTNLFLVPLDDNREWYRYHNLFSDLLRKRLLDKLPGMEKDLHIRASVWFESNGWITDAVHHAIEAEEIERAALLIENNTLAMLDFGRVATLIDWLEKIPDNIKKSRPWLSIAQAWIQVYAGQLDAAETYLAQATSVLDSLNGDDLERAVGQINTINAYASWLRGDGEKAVGFAQRALEKLPEQDLNVRALAATTLASGLVQCGDYAGANNIRRDAINWSRSSGNMHVYMLAVGSFAYVLNMQGRLSEAEELCKNVIDYVENQFGVHGGPSPAVAQVYSMFSELLVLRNETDPGVEIARKALRIGKRWGQVDTLTVNYVYLVSALLADGDIQGASDAIERGRRVGAHVSDWFDTIISHQEAEVMLASGNVAGAVYLAEQKGLGYQDDISQPNHSTYKTFSKILIAQEKYTEASYLLDRLINAAEHSGAAVELIGFLSLLAAAQLKQGKQEEAYSALDRALVLAEPERIIRPIIAAGDAIIPLLQKLITQGSVSHFAGELLLLLKIDHAAKNNLIVTVGEEGESVAGDNHYQLLEPLTSREIDVLKLLSSPLSVPEIADTLYLAPSTVRTHIRNIYSKLDVHGRFEAVQRAALLKLI